MASLSLGSLSRSQHCPTFRCLDMRPIVEDREASTVNGTYSDCAVETMNVNPTVKSLNSFDKRTVNFCRTLVHQ